MLVLIADAFDASLPLRLEALGDVEVTTDSGRLAEADVVLVRSKTRCSKDYIDAAPKLKLIIRGGVGLDSIDLAHAKARHIAVDNTPEASSVAVAEMAFALMIDAVSHVTLGHIGMRDGKWLKKELKRTELYQKTLGLIGVGRIGTELARRAVAFGMRVIGCDPYVTPSPVVTLMPLERVLKDADLLSLHTPLNDETRGLINAERLALTKPGVVLVNTARAACVDPAAIVAALTSGHVACYATDVWSKDPPPADDPLLSAPRVLMAPHLGASSKENLLRIGDLVVEKIRAFKGK